MTACVTGSASGIGAATRRMLEDDGHDVIGVDLRDAEVEADLSTQEGRDSAVAAVVAALGERPLDRLVCCAGLGPTVPPRLIAAVNCFGVVDVLDGLLAAMRDGGTPAAVVIASNSATFAAGDDDSLCDALLGDDRAAALDLAETLPAAQVYGQSKRAVTRAVRRRAQQWGEAGVRLNAVAPGPVDTPLLAAVEASELGAAAAALPIPLGRHASAAEIAGVVGFLLGPASAIVHGSVVFADGGIDAMVLPDRI
ncbi:MAG: SDR family oxidoreductase [Acidimicrobiia bacterium]|nr:SDR family oxidoreductase [Acidimicrobiia bacterium]